MIDKIVIEGYRSIRSLRLDLDRLTVVAGENGAGKTNLYRALEFLRAAATGTLARDLATEGGMPSVLWAGGGGRDRGPVRMRLAASLDTVEYDLVLGLPGPTDPALALDPVVKEERVAIRMGARRAVMLERKGPHIAAREQDGTWRSYHNILLLAETALATLRDPQQFPELQVLQKRMADWRFHHGFRVDQASPIRAPQVAICSPTLDSDGGNLAATLATAIHLKDGAQDMARSDIARAIDEAFPGSTLEFQEAGGRHAVAMRSPGFQRAFSAPELSDGTLRYLCLVGALCAYRRPDFIALNEPEASLHPGLIEPLGRMILRAAAESQVLVVTHSDALARLLDVEGGGRLLRLEKVGGETRILD